MAGYRSVGPDKRDEVNPKTYWHDMRRGGQRFAGVMSTPMAAAVLFFILAMFGFIIPAFSDTCFVIGIGFYFYIKKIHKSFSLPIKIPKQAKILDPHELNPGTGKPILAMGTFYLGNDRETNDEVWLTNRDAGVHMLVLGTTGSGKALRMDEPVLTPTGFKLMRELKVGDHVMHASGKPTTIVGVFPQGELQLYRITFADGRSMSVSGDHLWEVHHKHWNGKYKKGQSRTDMCAPRVLDTRQIQKQLETNKGTFSVPLFAPKLTLWEGDADLPLDPYLLGALLGDGGMSGRILSFTSDDKEIVDRVNVALGKLDMRLHWFEYHARYCYHVQMIDQSVKGYQGTAPIRPILSKLGLQGKLSHEKFVPKSYLSASPAVRLEVLRGLMDTDGTAGLAGSISFCSTSRQLAEDVASLVRSLGGIAKIRSKTTFYTHKGEKRQGRESFNVHIRIAQPSALFHVSRKSDRVAEYQYAESLKLKIVSVEELDEYEECQCIKVSEPDGLFVAGDYIVTHNTELLLGICQNALNHGSGFMFVDGKAQDKIAFKIMDLVRARGRDDDFLCLNFMTGAKDIIGPQPGKITNTMNPFSYGSSGMVSQIVVGLMASGGGGDDMWKDRAISFVEALSPPLTYLRDNYNIMLDVNKYRQYFELERVEELAWKFPEMYPGVGQVIEAAQNYLINLPGYDRNKFGKRGGQGEDTKLQHGFITMQLVRAFTSLADTYGHIVRVPLGEVYFPDLVKNRRILVVMLPSLEKTPSETANIGKIIVTALRNIMAEGLGAVLEGDRKDLDNDEGRAMLPPYVVILDEYGYYAVKGFAVAFAQARSLGFVCVVGGQDLASFQRESKEEAVSICGNTRIKFFGSIEDPEQTMKFAIETGGKAQVAKASSYEAEAGSFGMSFKDQMNVNFDMIDRINPSDVKEQKEGQFTIVSGSSVIRTKTYYVSPVPVTKVRLNHFIPVASPSRDQLEQIDMAVSGLVERFASADLSITVNTEPNRDIEAAVAAFRGARELGLGVAETGICAIVSVGIEREQYRRSFSEAVRSGGRGEKTPDTYQKIANAKSQRQDYYRQSEDEDTIDIPEGMFPDPVGTFQSEQDDQISMRSTDSAPDVSPDEMMNNPNHIRVDDMSTFEQMNVFIPPKKTTGFGADVFGDESEDAKRIEDILAAPEDDAPLLDYNATYQGIQSISRAMGSSEEEAGADARNVVKTIEDATRYPQSVPKEKSGDQVKNLLEDLIGLLGDE